MTLPLAAIGTMGVKSFADVDGTMQITNKTMGNTEQQVELVNKAMKEAELSATYGMKDAKDVCGRGPGEAGCGYVLWGCGKSGLL